MKITLLTQYFEPEIGAAQLRYSAIVRELAELGHQVTVLTAMPNHPTGRIFDGYRGRMYLSERTEWGSVHRGWVYPAIGSGPKRYLNFVSFVASALPMLRHARGSDVLVVESPPVTAGAVALVGRALLRCRLVTYVSDLSTNSIQDLSIPGAGIVTRLVRWLEDRVYQRSTYVTTVTDGLVRVLRDDFGVPPERIVMLANGADTETFRPVPIDADLLARFGVEAGRYVLYAGTHGYAHGLDVALAAAEQLVDDDVRFLFVGEGSDRERIVSEATSMGLRNVGFFGQQPPEVVAGLYAGAIAGLSTVRDIQIMHDARPAKLFACLSCARPLVYSGAGEGARLVEQAGGGIVTAPGDPDAIVAAVRRLQVDPALASAMGESGRQWVLDNYSWKQLVRRWADTVLTD